MATIVKLPQLVEYILGNPSCFPGSHNVSQPRTSRGLPSLDTKRQMMLIFKAIREYVQEVLESGRGVNLEHLGAFTFEPLVTHDGNQKNERAPALKLRPCFLVSEELKKTLYRFHNKEQLSVHVAGSVYQQGTRMTFLNRAPIAAGTYYSTQVVADVAKALCKGVCDLSQRGYNLEVDMGFCLLQIENRDLKVRFAKSFLSAADAIGSNWPAQSVTLPSETGMSASQSMGSLRKPLSDTWKSRSLSRSMSNFQRPDSAKLAKLKMQTEKLAAMSMDLTGCCRVVKA